jgi:hypothetical protein
LGTSGTGIAAIFIMVALKPRTVAGEPVSPGDGDQSAGGSVFNSRLGSGRAKQPEGIPAEILFEEFGRLKLSLNALGIGFSLSQAKGRNRGGKPRKLPYFACCYDAGTLARVNIVAFYYPLIADWELMEADADRYRQRVKSALREEMIHAVQVLTVKKRYESSCELRRRFADAESYYDHLLGRMIGELARNEVGKKAIITAAKLYYEDWTINSLAKLKKADRKYHGRDGYLVCELIRQLTQIRFGELMSEEAKGKAWDRRRIFFVGEYGTTENLMMAMAATLRQAMPQLINLSPTLNEALCEIEVTIQTIGGITGVMLKLRNCAGA